MIFALILAFIGTVFADTVPYCEYWPGDYYVVTPLIFKYSKPYTLANAQVDMDAKGSKIATTAVDGVVDSNGKNVYLETYQFAKGRKGVFLRSSINAQLVDCERIAKVTVLKVLYDGGYCLAPIHKQVRTFCQRHSAKSRGLLYGGKGKSLASRSVLLTAYQSAVQSEIFFNVKDFLVLKNFDKAVFGDAKASSFVSIKAKGGTIKGDVKSTNIARDNHASSYSKISISGSSHA